MLVFFFGGFPMHMHKLRSWCNWRGTSTAQLTGGCNPCMTRRCDPLQVHKKFSEMVDASFVNDPSFVAALDRACKKFVNNNAVTKLAKTTAKSLPS